MKINIITLHYAHNYGAVLQAYALKHALINMEHEVNIVNYIPKNDAIKYQKNLKSEMRLRYAIHHLKLITWVKEEVQTLQAKVEWKQRVENFNTFINKELISGYMNNQKLSYEEIKKLQVDCFISGSDQVWNSNITGECNPVYYLDFEDNKAKRIAYAASMGKVKVPNETEKNFLGKWLREIDEISVREEELKKMLELEYGIEKIKVVIDPCLLITADDFNQLKQKSNLENEKYQLAYFINEKGLLKENFKDKDKLNDTKIIEIHWKRQLFQKNKNQRNDLAVSDFLWYIDNAETIYTDSFHGVVLSLIFHKNFYAVFDKDTRVEDLLTKVGLIERHILSVENNKEKDISEIQWKYVDSQIEKMRKESLDFLEKALK